MFACRMLLGMAGLAVPSAALDYPVVTTSQVRCYDDRSEIQPPSAGQPFHGQDAQNPSRAASHSVSPDGLTVRDLATGLTWQRSPDHDGKVGIDRSDKMSFADALAYPAKLNAARFGGFDDWRLPTIKELYSLFHAAGTDPSGPTMSDASNLKPFIDTRFFQFGYGNTKQGERIIDAQFVSATKYTGESIRNQGKVFGVNFADGRIKGYDLAGPGGRTMLFYVLCVRGNPAYGRNAFEAGAGGTVFDRATGLEWARDDSGKGLNWREALAWVQQMNRDHYLGHDDWRLPNIKELQSIVDYSRSPDSTHSAAIDPVFHCTTITNEVHQADFPYYWSSTTHAGLRGGAAAMYIAFGRAAGWMPPPGGRQGPYHYMDVHGAGAQRSDPKEGDPALFPHGRGPQGDVIRIHNFVRLVRGGAE
ncbi:MAG: DUF1566 domain-containing protein [Verrucomicrobiota bacterium]